MHNNGHGVVCYYSLRTNIALFKTLGYGENSSVIEHLPVIEQSQQMF